MKLLSQAISEMTQDDIIEFETNGSFQIKAGTEMLELAPEDVDIVSQDIPGWEVNTDGKLTVALDVTISDDLREEGIARELINRNQNIRKEKGFEVTDKIVVKIKQDDFISKPVQNNLTYICNEILASSLNMVDHIDENESILIEVDDNNKVLTSINKFKNGN